MIAAQSPEELRLLLEPMPFFSDEHKEEIISGATVFFDFMKFLTDKYKVRHEVIEARIETALHVKFAAKMPEWEDKLENDDDEKSVTLEFMSDVYSEVAKEEGFEGDIKMAMKNLLGMEPKMEAHIQKLIEEGKEEELERFVELMEKKGKK